MEFEKSKWNERFDGFYKYRENMVQDLMGNYLEKGMELKRVIELLGEPENYQNKKENEKLIKYTKKPTQMSGFFYNLLSFN